MIPDDACTAIRKIRKDTSIVYSKRKVKVKVFKVSLKMHFNKSNKNAVNPFHDYKEGDGFGKIS